MLVFLWESKKNFYRSQGKEVAHNNKMNAFFQKKNLHPQEKTNAV